MPSGGLIGLEREALRVTPAGRISQRPHPFALGSALTHPHITTDYSEALIELITPPCHQPEQSLAFLADTHAFVYRQLDDEVLWANSMPCIIDDPENIPIAHYGPSNAGQMKRIYRIGLGHRYGRMMQVISGIHLNYSLPLAFWEPFRALEGDRRELRAFIDHHYFAMIRNLQRHGWLIPYLFGASPAICNTFLATHDSHHLQSLPGGTRYEPYATSLRMGDIGYTNRKEACAGIKANYDDLNGYLASLRYAIHTPCEVWQQIGLRDRDGGYRQLNANILQIENEYYSTIRPKQLQHHLEKPTDALANRGVLYVELRSLDIDPFTPLGIDTTRMRFLESFLLYCLLSDSPPIDPQERKFIDRNLEETAHQGRAPDFQLAHPHGPRPLQQWLHEILNDLEGVCQLLDSRSDQPRYRTALDQVRAHSAPEATPSARILDQLRQRGIGFYDFSREQSERHRDHFLHHPIDPQRETLLQQLGHTSHQQQQQLEQADTTPFAEFLAAYLAP